MQATRAKQVFEIIDYNGWLTTPDRELQFSDDQLIDAYVKGKEDGIKNEKSLIGETIKGNMRMSADVARRVVADMRGIGFSPLKVFLKISDLRNYYLMITIPEQEFLDDKVIEVYDHLTKVEEEVKNDYFALNISLCDVTPHFNEKCLAADGYSLKLTRLD